ncbi:hypothetical protein FORC82_3684 [Escherichia coli]|nr:hypothetical protein FORC82_3684 [Escherichia coli]CDK71725.1 FIG00642974: hypothetical protein [Klebsiella pneumoniae IS22]
MLHIDRIFIWFVSVIFIMRMLQKQNYLQHVEILCFYEFDACFSP